MGKVHIPHECHFQWEHLSGQVIYFILVYLVKMVLLHTLMVLHSC